MNTEHTPVLNTDALGSFIGEPLQTTDITPLLSEAYNRGIQTAIDMIARTIDPIIANPIIERLEKLKQ